LSDHDTDYVSTVQKGKALWFRLNISGRRTLTKTNDRRKVLLWFGEVVLPSYVKSGQVRYTEATAVLQ
jgi:hypothetical protein